MKKLQDLRETSWQFNSFAQLTGIKRDVDAPQEIILLLHGLGERGKRTYRKLVPYLPENAKVIAPDGPFPLPRNKEGRLAFGHAWYFFDKFEQKYFLNQDLAKYWLRDLIKMENPRDLPVTIIGFSQGGYLAPLVGKEILETKLVIGLACEFRMALIKEKPNFPMVGIHGDQDEIIGLTMAQKEIEKLKTLDIPVEFHIISGVKHEITSSIGEKVKSVLEQYGN